MRICHEVVLNMLKLLSIPSLSCSIGASTSFFRASSKHAVQNGTLVFNPHFLHQIRDQNHTLHHSWCHIQVRETIPGRELHEQILIQNFPFPGHPREDMCPAMNHTQLALFAVSEWGLLNKLSRCGANLVEQVLVDCHIRATPPPWPGPLGHLCDPLLDHSWNHGPSAATACTLTLVDAPSNDSYLDYTLLRKIHLVSYSLETWLRGCELQCYCYLTFSRLLITLGPTGIFRQVCRIRQESLPPIQSKWPESWYRRHHLL